MDLRERASGEPLVRHPWERARASYFEAVLEAWAPEARSILDVGSGDAWLARQVAGGLGLDRVVCWDVHYEDADLGRERVGAAELERTRAEPEGHFDALMLLDVLEHVEDDRGFLSDLVERKLAPGGGVLASVPAWPALFSDHDRFLGHYRRYRPRELVALGREVGLEVEASGGLFHGLLPVRAAQVWASRASGAGAAADEPESDLAWSLGEPLARAIAGILRLEGRVSRAAARRSIAMPGLSTWFWARRPE